MNEEGWYIDPFGKHEARWFSDGTPTSLVRDGDVESEEPPPADPVPGVPERVPETTPQDGTDLRRADEAEKGEFDPQALTQAASEAIDSTPGF